MCNFKFTWPWEKFRFINKLGPKTFRYVVLSSKVCEINSGLVDSSVWSDEHWWTFLSEHEWALDLAANFKTCQWPPPVFRNLGTWIFSSNRNVHFYRALYRLCISRFCNLTFVNFQFSRQITNEDITERNWVCLHNINVDKILGKNKLIKPKDLLYSRIRKGKHTL